MKYIPQYVIYILLAHFLFLTSSYVLVLVLYKQLDQKKNTYNKTKTKKDPACREEPFKSSLSQPGKILEIRHFTLYLLICTKLQHYF